MFDSDKLGNTLNTPKDENNHEIDALRYALRPYLNDYDGSLGVNWNEQYEIGERMGVNY